MSKRLAVIKLRARPASNALKMFAIIGWCLALFGLWAFVETIGRWKEEDLAAATMFTFWGLVIGVVCTQSWRFGSTHLRVDLGRGTATFVEDRLDRVTVPLVELGEVAIEAHKGQWYTLTASGMPKRVLFQSGNRLQVEMRRVRIEQLVGEALIRQLIAHDAPHDGAFRDDPALVFRAKQLVPNDVRLLEVLDRLERDDDAKLVTHVRELRLALRPTDARA